MTYGPDEHGVWGYCRQPNGDVYGSDFGPNVILVNGIRISWGYMLRGDFAPMQDVSEECRNWVYSLDSKHKEFICEILKSDRGQKAGRSTSSSLSTVDTVWVTPI